MLLVHLFQVFKFANIFQFFMLRISCIYIISRTKDIHSTVR